MLWFISFLFLCLFFFFFKQKTAYEMLRSLVGSEMCIRDRTRPSRSSLALTAARIILDPGYGAAVWTRDTGRSLRPRPRQHRRWVLRATPLDTPGIRRDGVSGGAALRPTRPLVAQPVARQPEPSSRPCTGQVITTLGSVVIEAVASRYRLEP